MSRVKLKYPNFRLISRPKADQPRADNPRSLISILFVIILYSIFQLLSPAPAQAALDGSGSGLVGWWKFDETSGTVAADSSGNNNSGTLVNGPVWTTGQVGSAFILNRNLYPAILI